MAPRAKLVSLQACSTTGGKGTGQQHHRGARLDPGDQRQRPSGSASTASTSRVGYEFDAEWFACGQSPLCVEVDRLVAVGRGRGGGGRQHRLRHACNERSGAPNGRPRR